MLYVNPLDFQLTRLQHGMDNPETRRVALQEMEHMFLFTLLQEMRKTMAETVSEPQSHEKQLYMEMLDDSLSAEIARSGQFGIAKQLECAMDAAVKKSAAAAENKEGGGMEWTP